MPPPHVDSRTFLKYLRRSGLVRKRDIKKVLAELPQTDRGRVVARAMVERGLITKFQAEMVLAGRTSGFLLGQYRILDQLGQGGMGRVFKAVHLTMNRIVALKVLAPHLVKTERAQELFQHEVRAAGQLMHPNIVTAYDANHVDGRHYLVMEYVDGPNLDQLIRENGPLPIGQACEMVRQAAHGLQYAFERGMVHRDIKPANMLLQRTSSAENRAFLVKILDFGLARLQENDAAVPEGPLESRENTVMGTPDFLSPEQARDLHNVDIRSDLYSLGCTLYYLLSATMPFPGGTMLEKMIRHTSEEATPIEELRPEVPAALAAIVHRLLAKDPADRFQTPADLADALLPFVGGEVLSWFSRSKTSPFLDRLSTPSFNLQEAVADADRRSALSATFPSATLPTPISSDILPAPSRNHRQRIFGWWFAAGVAAGLVGLMISMLLR
jgi:serine/threonine protein kinase